MMGLHYPSAAVFVIVTSIFHFCKSLPVTRKLNSTDFEYLRMKLTETHGAPPPVLFLPGTIKDSENERIYTYAYKSGPDQNCTVTRTEQFEGNEKEPHHTTQEFNCLGPKSDAQGGNSPTLPPPGMAVGKPMSKYDIEYTLELVSGKLRNVQKVITATEKAEEGKTLYTVKCVTMDGDICIVELTRHDDGSERSKLSCGQPPLSSDNAGGSENATIPAQQSLMGKSETFVHSRGQRLKNLVALIAKTLLKLPDDPGLSKSIINSLNSGSSDNLDVKSLSKRRGNRKRRKLLHLLQKLDKFLKGLNKPKNERDQLILHVLKKYYINRTSLKNHKAATSLELPNISNTADSVLTSNDRIENKYKQNLNKQKHVRNQMTKPRYLGKYDTKHQNSPKKYEFLNNKTKNILQCPGSISGASFAPAAGCVVEQLPQQSLSSLKDPETSHIVESMNTTSLLQMTDRREQDVPPKDPGRPVVITFIEQITRLITATKKLYERSGDMSPQEYHRVSRLLRGLLDSYINNGYRLTPNDLTMNIDRGRKKSAYGLMMVAVEELKKHQKELQENNKALAQIQKEIGILIKGCEETPVSKSSPFTVLVQMFEDAEQDIGVLLRNFNMVAKTLLELQGVPRISEANLDLIRAILDNIVKYLSFLPKAPNGNHGSKTQRKEKARIPSHNKDELGSQLSPSNPPYKSKALGTIKPSTTLKALPSKQNSK